MMIYVLCLNLLVVWCFIMKDGNCLLYTIVEVLLVDSLMNYGTLFTLSSYNNNLLSLFCSRSERFQ